MPVLTERIASLQALTRNLLPILFNLSIYAVHLHHSEETLLPTMRRGLNGAWMLSCAHVYRWW